MLSYCGAHMYKFHLPSDEVPSEWEISLNPENQKLFDYYVQPTLIVLQSVHFPRRIAVLYSLYIDFEQAI